MRSVLRGTLLLLAFCLVLVACGRNQPSGRWIAAVNQGDSADFCAMFPSIGITPDTSSVFGVAGSWHIVNDTTIGFRAFRPSGAHSLDTFFDNVLDFRLEDGSLGLRKRIGYNEGEGQGYCVGCTYVQS